MYNVTKTTIIAHQNCIYVCCMPIYYNDDDTQTFSINVSFWHNNKLPKCTYENRKAIK